MTTAVAPDKVYEACLVELYKTMRAASFYALDHPALAQAATRALRYFQNLLRVVDRLEFTITRQQIMLGERPLRGQQQVLTALAGDLFRRRVKKLIFLPGIELDDMLGFLRAFKLDADQVARRGGFENALAQFGVKAIWPNEVDFNRLEEAAEFEEEEEELEEEEDTEELSPEQEALRDLLRRLTAADAGPFMLLLKEVVERGRNLLETREYAEVGLILETLLACTEDNDRHLVAREYSEKAIRALASRELVQFKIAELEKAGDRQIERLLALFELVGRLTVPFLLTALGTANDRAARRNLSRAIVSFGEKAVPRAVEMLGDDRWYVKRNILGILADIGNASILGQVEPYLVHEDPRVAKEAVRTVWRLGADDGLRLLATTWPRLVPEVRMHVVMLFGALRWLEGRSVLEKVALDPKNVDLQLAACEALGKLSEPESFPVLARLYRKKGLVGREKRLPVRRAALKALLNYGEPAEPLLRRALVERDPTLVQTARQGLERLAETQGKTEESA